MFLNLSDSPCDDSPCDDIKILNMTKPSEMIDDLAQMAGGAAGLFSSAGQQIRDDIKARVEDMATRLDLVPREDLDRVETLLEKALNEQKEIKTRLNALEKKEITNVK